MDICHSGHKCVLLSATENGHTVNYILYPVSKQFKRAYGPDILCMEK